MARQSAQNDRLTCQCAISYHQVHFEDGHVVQRLDEGEELPSLMVMCFGRCQRCGLPFHTEFSCDES
jgi:hypothetical protein